MLLRIKMKFWIIKFVWIEKGKNKKQKRRPELGHIYESIIALHGRGNKYVCYMCLFSLTGEFFYQNIENRVGLNRGKALG